MAVSAAINGGTLYTPYIVKSLKEPETNTVIKSFNKTKKRTVISKETSDKVRDALEHVVALGSGRNAYIEGYRVGGKTATGENGRGENLKYLAGYAGVAPINNPEIVVVMNLYDPKGVSGHGGATVCGPVVGSIIDETLRYLDIKPDYTLEENNIKEKLIPNVTGKTVAEAKNILTENGFVFVSDVELNDTDIINVQIPKDGASLMEGSQVRVYTSEDQKQTVSVPDVRNKTSDKAIEEFKNAGLNTRVVGSGYVLTQDPSPGSVIDKGSIVTIKCVDTTELP